MKKILLFLLVLLNTSSVFAQNRGEERNLPNYSTLEEALLPYQQRNPFDETTFLPLPKNLRAMAEWEELQGLSIAWQGQNLILSEIVRAARLECNVSILCKDSTTLKSCKAYLISKNIDVSSNVSFLIKPTDSIWMRDYGPNPVYQNDVDSLAVVDWVYNRNRPNDDTCVSAISKFYNIPLYKTLKKPEDLVHTGGNFMSDGLGNGFSSKLIFDENGLKPNVPTSIKTEGQIDSIMQKYMGITRYTKMETLPYDAIHHIDMHMKLLDEETLIISQYANNVADGAQIEANLQYVLKNFKTPYGKPYKVVRILSPPDANGKYPDKNGQYRTYSNMTFVNKTVLVPYYEQKYDTTAERILKAALPGYKIVGINCNAIIGQLGAIHCITKELGVPDPLWITHEKKTDVANYIGEKIPVAARIQHRSGIKEATVWYKTSNEVVFKPLTLQSTNANNWAANFENLPNNSIIQYYIESTAKNAKKIHRPITAPEGFYSFKLGGATTATNDENVLNTVKIYPNPARAMTCVEVQNTTNSEAIITLFDALGRSIKTLHDGILQDETSRFFFAAADYQRGIYFIKIKTKQGEQVEKVVIE
jgi:agmatine deiminase